MKMPHYKWRHFLRRRRGDSCFVHSKADSLIRLQHSRSLMLVICSLNPSVKVTAENCSYSQLQCLSWEWVLCRQTLFQFCEVTAIGAFNKLHCSNAGWLWFRHLNSRNIDAVIRWFAKLFLKTFESSGPEGTVIFSWLSDLWRLLPFNGVRSILRLVDIDSIRLPVTWRHQRFSVLVLDDIRKLPAEWFPV